jgi:hypothetical protein
VPCAITTSQPDSLGLARVIHLACQHHHHHAGGFQLRDDCSGDAQPGDEGLRATFDDRVHALRQAVRLRGQQINAERPVGQVAHPAHLLANSARADAGHAQRAEAAGIAHRSANLGIRNAPHPGQQDRMIDAQQIADGGAQHHAALRIALP